MPDSSSPPPDWREYWNERYLREPSRYGDEANEFVVEAMSGLSPRRILDAACGQGRNAVWLARRGHEVTAIDLSDVAVQQGQRLAKAAGVEVDFREADLFEYSSGSRFGAVLLSYLQLPPESRRRAHDRVKELLSPGGTVVVVAHHADNLEEGVGGPVYPEVLYREEDVAADFAGFDIVRNERVVRHVDREGVVGAALDLLFVGRAPALASEPAD
jgi:2-polyprenyl-3-methyl-5-hydroxy-6-metoxy-1,4-benzoquinol methylase